MGDLGHELWFGCFLTPDARQAEAVVELTRLADRLGLDLVGVQDHPYQARFLDTWTLLSVLAAETERIRLLPDVINLPLRPPAVLARAADGIVAAAPRHEPAAVAPAPVAADGRQRRAEALDGRQAPGLPAPRVPPEGVRDGRPVPVVQVLAEDWGGRPAGMPAHGTAAAVVPAALPDWPVAAWGDRSRPAPPVLVARSAAERMGARPSPDRCRPADAGTAPARKGRTHQARGAPARPAELRGC